MMSFLEKRVALAVAALMGFRMLGLFLLAPVLPVLALHLKDATPAWVGLSVGVYGLTQALLQIPLGWLSDRWGRKPVIMLGLMLFILGGVVAAFSQSIWGVIIGRALQGAGAIASALLALLSDVSSESNRAKLMAIVGITIGATFSVSVILGPVLARWLSLEALFLATTACGFVGLAIAWRLPASQQMNRGFAQTPFMQALLSVMLNPVLASLYISIFMLHLVLTAVFVVFPYQLVHRFDLPLTSHWHIYLPLILSSFLLIFPLLGWSERRKKHKLLLLTSIASMVVGLLIFSLKLKAISWVLIAFWVMFTAFNLMEATLPSLISRLADQSIKGTALGLFSSAQFLGAFAGGVVGGLMLEYRQVPLIMGIGVFACVLWWVLLKINFRPGVKRANIPGSWESKQLN